MSAVRSGRGLRSRGAARMAAMLLGATIVLTACADDGGDAGASWPDGAPAASGTAPVAARPSESPAADSVGPDSVGPAEPDADGTEAVLEPPSAPPPYIDAAGWVQTAVGPSLQIRPTPAGRRVTGDGVAGEAWNEVLALAPDGDTPGMRMQFDCHWSFARLVEPDKPSWNLEPGRPVVTEQEMIAARCNPGFAEES